MVMVSGKERGSLLMSDRLTRYKAIVELTIQMHTWLDTTDYVLPYLPEGVATLMAEQAFAVKPDAS